MLSVSSVVSETHVFHFFKRKTELYTASLLKSVYTCKWVRIATEVFSVHTGTDLWGKQLRLKSLFNYILYSCFEKGCPTEKH